MKLKVSAQIRKQYRTIIELVNEEDFQEARRLFRQLPMPFRFSDEIIDAGIEIHGELKDWHGLLPLIWKFHHRHPTDLESWMNMIWVLANLEYPALALTEIALLRQSSPSKRIRDSLDELEPELKEFVDSFTRKAFGTQADKLALCARHDLVRLHMQLHDFDKAYDTAVRLVDEAPGFAPGRNNLAEILYHQGDIEGALEQCREVIEQQPLNAFALAGYVKCALLSDEKPELPPAFLEKPLPFYLAKQMEAVVLAGDYPAALRLITMAEQEKGSWRDNRYLAFHLAAFSAWSIGERERAEELWRRAEKEAPEEFEVRKHLDDLDIPPGERTTPWALPFHQLVPSEIFREISETKKDTRLRRIVADHQWLINLAKLLLRIGDQAAVHFAQAIHTVAGDAGLHSALIDFCQGDRLSDDVRLKLRLGLERQGVTLPNEMSVGGEKKEVFVFGFEVTGEAQECDPRTAPFQLQAHALLAEKRAAEAEKVLREGLAHDQSDPRLWYNLAMALRLQDRNDEAHAIVERLHRDFPDYLFSRVAVARKAVDDGDESRAEEILHSLWQRKKFHPSELRAVLHLSFEMARRKSDLSRAENLLRIWADAIPGDKHVVKDMQRSLTMLRRMERDFKAARTILRTARAASV